MPIEPDAVVGNYRLTDELDSGGMGTVWRANPVDGGAPVALKFCHLTDADALRRFAREVRAMQRMSHPNVVRILDFELEHSPPYFVMPYSETGLIDHMPAELRAALATYLHICEGVRALHAAGVIHRDIKPDNMRVFGDVPVVTDLGLAKFTSRDTTILTATLALVGTEAFLAPEQRLPAGSRDADERTDVYQLGRSLYALLTKQSPVLMDLSGFDPFIRAIVERATRERPEERYQSVAQLIDAISGYLASTDPSNDPVPQLQGTLVAVEQQARFGQYSPDQIGRLVDLLLTPVLIESQETWLGYFDQIPLPVIELIGATIPAHLQERLFDIYRACIIGVIRDRPFEYAEAVGQRVDALAKSPMLEPNALASALQALLAAAVRLNRFAAMDQFNRILRSTRTPERANAVAAMLAQATADYRQIAGNVPSLELHPAIRAVQSMVLREN